ncbi:MAG: DUF4474 domain-containing protein, partial [Synergistaceae bacterium]|nr:DUF4474 domain-containing protein [Synergistaceae bacterium]
ERGKIDAFVSGLPGAPAVKVGTSAAPPIRIPEGWELVPLVEDGLYPVNLIYELMSDRVACTPANFYEEWHPYHIRAKDHDGDGVPNVEEGVALRKQGTTNVFGIIFVSHPGKIDSDGDEIEDKEDHSPLVAWDPNKSSFGKVVNEAGFLYADGLDLLYARKDAKQRDLGFTYLYDEGIAGISSFIHCEPIYFIYNEREYMIELWKGQYGIEIGAEIGVYRRELGDPRLFDKVKNNYSDIVQEIIQQAQRFGNIPPEIGAVLSTLARAITGVTDPKVFRTALAIAHGFLTTPPISVFPSDLLRFLANSLGAILSGLEGKFYKCALGGDMLEMSYTLKHNGQELFSRSTKDHWWLTGFKWGHFAEPHELEMDVTITFLSAKAEAFVRGYDRAYYMERFKEETPERDDYNNDNKWRLGLDGLGYRYNIVDHGEKKKSVSFTFGSTPRSRQPYITTTLARFVQDWNRTNVQAYNDFKSRHLDYKGNDPNELEARVMNLIPEHRRTYDAFMKIIVDVVNMAFAIAKAVVK